MASISKSSNITIEVNGKTLKPPREWFDVGILASFEQQVQANISTEKFSFVLDTYTELKNHIAGGLTGATTGIFEGVPIKLKAVNNSNELLVFNGFIDLADNAIIDDDIGQIQANIKKLAGLNSLSDNLEALDYGFLYDNGNITNSDFIDLQYTVVKVNSSFESLTTAIMLYLLLKQLAESIRIVAKTIAEIAGIAGAGITGSISAIAYGIAVVIINIAYAAAILAATLSLARDLITTFVPPVRKHKTILFKTLLERALDYLGYSFNTTIPELDYLHYLPSNISYDEYDERGFFRKAGTIGNALPNVTDYGYSCFEIFELARQLFNGRFVVVESTNTVEFHSENSSYWLKTSTYIKPNQLKAPYSFNTNELGRSYIIQFTTDPLADEYTLENYTGTSYQVLTALKNVGNQKQVNINGLTDIRFNVALGNRKNELTGFEKFLAAVAGTFDDVIRVLGGSSNLRNQITNRVGILKVSSNYHTVPKLLYLEGGKMPVNHRAKFSAKTLWDNYHSYNSFIDSNYRRQRKVIRGEKIPFGFEDFLKLINNSYFSTFEGDVGKMERIEWNILKDYAVVDYWVEQVYTKNLKQTKIEA